ncbi:MAG TPA: hypothetical protein PL160_01810 [Candidatus Cloacimonas sp.]|nr:hypothetical protein [Candidatus Cloacimonas sp.]
MKVTFNYGIRTYSGTIDEITFGSYRKDSVCIARKYVIPRTTENNTQMGNILKNLATVYAAVASDYKEELKMYAVKNEQNIPAGQLAPNTFAIWVKMMFRFSELNVGHIDLSSVTYNDLQTVGEDILSISLAVQNGYLADVPGSETFTSNM